LLNYVFTPAQKLAELQYPDNDVSVKLGHHTLKVFSPRNNRIGRALYKDRIWEPEVTAAIEQTARPGMIALDVGADIGYYALNLARLVGPEGRVIAFEPIPKARARLEQNIAANGYKNITISDFALGNQEGVVYLEDPLNKSRISLSKGEGSSNDIKVRIRRMDELITELGIERIDIVKMDIEGAEHEALLGMEELLKKCHPILVVEVHNLYLPQFNSTAEKLLSWLSGLGYKIETIYEAGLGENPTTQTVCCRFS